MVSDCWHRSQWLHQPEGAKAGPAQLQQLSIQWWNLPDDDQSVPLTQLKYCSLLITHFCCWRWHQLSILMVNVDDFSKLCNDAFQILESRYWKIINRVYLLQICSTRPKLAALTCSASQLSGCFCSSGGQYSTSLTVTAQGPLTAMSCIKVSQTEDKKKKTWHFCHLVHGLIFSGMKYQTVQVLQTQ